MAHHLLSGDVQLLQRHAGIRALDSILESRCHAASRIDQVMNETDPTGKCQHDVGAKMDEGKVPIMRGSFYQFPNALEKVAELSEIGARKYTWEGWHQVPDGVTRYREARGRHELALAKGEQIDRDTGVRHLVQVAWNALAQLELELRKEVHGEQDGFGDDTDPRTEFV